ncbi:hypothetical protein [Gordonia sp. (in: high G+C Gram-positive bacteria)]|uniref:Gp37-like protein n=1 Tax=Gordonia sp. (in: high G+C Gram-positive bacteria) TaxID=84139 RepID=UPI0039E53C57
MSVAEHVDNLEDFRLWAEELRNDRIRRRAKAPRIRLWDGNYKYRGQTGGGELDFSFPFELNDTGKGDLRLPISNDDKRGTYLAHWIMAEHKRGTKGVYVTVDKDGARWSGRIDEAVIERDPKGDSVLVTFDSDYDQLKNVHCAPNPFLPLNVVQFPKIFMLGGPTIHTLKLALFLNLLRLRVTNFTLPSDPLNPAAWVGLDFSDWPIVVKPGSILDDNSMWTIISSKMGSWHDMAAAALDDAELYVECRRWLTGDPEPWEGANLRNGTLVVDIIDKSGFRTGTSFGGNLATGLARAVKNVTSNEVEDAYDLITGDPILSDEDLLPNVLGTHPANPGVVYRDGLVTGIQTSKFRIKAAGPCRITTGGKSAPFVNELMKAAVNYCGDVLGDNIQVPGVGVNVGSLGSAIDAFIHGFYEDTLFAYNSVPLLQRAAEDGWAHLQETIVSGVNQAYVLSAALGLRQRRRETDGETSFELVVMDASPWMIGDQGKGHWFMGDRVGATNKYLGARVYVRRCRRLVLAGGRDTAVGWKADFGDLRTNADALTKGLKMLESFMSDMQVLGAW